MHSETRFEVTFMVAVIAFCAGLVSGWYLLKEYGERTHSESEFCSCKPVVIDCD